jgi:putative endonuclease
VPFVYILRCGDGSLYTGAARDMSRRLVEHRAGTASKYTRSRLPVVLAWSLRVRDWPRALRLEWHIKRLDRVEKLALVSGARRPPRAPRRS